MKQRTRQLFYDNRSAWRAWLAEHHDGPGEVWLVFYKKHTGRTCLSYDDAVEEALCFGWIDSLIKRLDDDRYARKFTPRSDTRRWSQANLKRIELLRAAGLMTDAGLAKVPSDARPEAPASSRTLEVPEFLALALAGNPLAREHFEGLAPSHRRNYIHWLSDAKREATRRRRLAEAISRLERGEKLGMK